MRHFRSPSNFDKCRPEAPGDVISGPAFDYVGTDVPAWFGDSRLHNGRIIRLCPAGPVLRPFVWYLVTFCNRPEGASDVVSDRFVMQIVLERFVQLGHPHLNRSREVQPDAVGRGIFDSFFAIPSDRNHIMTSYPLWLWNMLVCMSR